MLHILGIAAVACGVGALLFARKTTFEPDCPGIFVRWKAFFIVYCIPAVVFPLIAILVMMWLGFIR